MVIDQDQNYPVFGRFVDQAASELSLVGEGQIDFLVLLEVREQLEVG